MTESEIFNAIQNRKILFAKVFGVIIEVVILKIEVNLFDFNLRDEEGVIINIRALAKFPSPTEVTCNLYKDELFESLEKAKEFYNL